MRKLLVLLSLLGVLAVAAPAEAVTTTFRVDSVGDWTSPATANISGTATCEGGTGTITFTTLTGTPYAVNGEVAVVCDGLPHTWAATIVGGPWTPRQGIVFRARLVAPSGTVMQVPKVVLV